MGPTVGVPGGRVWGVSGTLIAFGKETSADKQTSEETLLPRLRLDSDESDEICVIPLVPGNSSPRTELSSMNRMCEGMRSRVEVKRHGDGNGAEVSGDTHLQGTETDKNAFLGRDEVKDLPTLRNH